MDFPLSGGHPRLTNKTLLGWVEPPNFQTPSELGVAPDICVVLVPLLSHSDPPRGHAALAPPRGAAASGPRIAGCGEREGGAREPRDDVDP